MERIGRYQITGELGRGAMGVVYRAIDPSIGRTVAIKTIRLSEFTAPGERERLRERLFREAQSAGILSHPGIVTIYDIAEEGETTCIFMEFVNGPTLDHLLAGDQPPSNDVIINVFRQTAAALDYAHQKGIVHRDIKPANLMIHEDGRGKITDFGIAKIGSQQMTQAGMMMGTPNYMSPEQVQGAAVDGRADQFALAVIAYETLTGERPFVAEPLPALLYKIVREEPIPTHLVNPTLDSQVNEVLRKAMAKDPAARYATCTQFAAALETACEASPGWRALSRGASSSLPTLASPTPPPPPPPPPPAPPAPPSAPPAPPPAMRRPSRYGDEQGARRPKMWWRSMVAVLIAAGIVGTVFVVAKKLTAPAEQPPAQVAQQPAPPPASPPVDKPVEPPAQPPAPEPEVKKPSPMSPPIEEGPREKPQPVSPPPRAKEPAPPAEQMVLLRSTPPGAKVVIDDRLELGCTTPCSVSLPHGRHMLTATLSAHHPATRVFEVPKQSELYLNLARNGGMLIVKTIPPGAIIFLNGQERPEKTPAMIPLAVGRYKLLVSKLGYKDDDQDIDMKDGSMLEASFTLGK